MILRRRSLAGFRPFALACLALVAVIASGADPSIRTIGTAPNFPTLVPSGSSVTITNLNGINQPTVSDALQWLLNDQPVPGATGPELSLTNVVAAQAGNYRLAYTDTAGVTRYTNTETINVLPASFSPIDRSFSSDIPANVFYAYPILAGADGRVIIGMYDDAAATTTIARLSSNGRLDSSFHYPASAGTPLAVLSDGGLITSQSPFRLAADGSPFLLRLPAGFDPANPIVAAAVQPDGKFFLAQNTHLVRFESDGRVDPSFNDGGSAAGDILRITLDFQKRLFVKRSSPGSLPVTERLGSTGAPDITFVPPTEVRTMFDVFRDLAAIFPLNGGGYLAFYGRSVIKLRDNGSRDEAWGLIALPVHSIFSTAVDAAGNVFLLSGSLSRLAGTANGGGSLDPTFFPGVAHKDGAPIGPAAMILAPEGHLLVGGHFTDWDGHLTPKIARLRTDGTDPIPPATEIIQTNPFKRDVDVSLAANVIRGTDPFTFQWLALDGQPLPANTTGAELDLGLASLQQFGRYQLRVTSPGGTTLSQVLAVGFPENSLYLANLSGRAQVGEGENTIIAGVTAERSAFLLLRGVGPALRHAGLVDYAATPRLTVFNPPSQPQSIGSWGDDPGIAQTSAAVGASPLGAGDPDAAGYAVMLGSTATLHLVDPSSIGKTALCEIYPVPPTRPLTNLSFRARTAPGDATAIAGFVIVDTTNFGRTSKVLLRAVGSFAPGYGITHPLENPVLTLYDANNAVVTRNDDWQDSANLAELTAAMSKTSGLPGSSRDAALLLDLPPGAYTLHASGGSGVVLLDVFLVQ